MHEQEDINNDELLAQLKVFNFNVYGSRNQKKNSKKLLKTAIERVYNLRVIRIKESTLLEQKAAIWDKIWLINSIYLVIVSIFTLIFPHLIKNSDSVEVLSIYAICLTIIVLVMTYYIKSQNFEKVIAIKHHEQSAYRNLITEAVILKTKYYETNRNIYTNFINQRNMITQFNDNHSKLAYYLAKEKIYKRDDLEEKINNEYKNEFRTLKTFSIIMIGLNIFFLSFDIVRLLLSKTSILFMVFIPIIYVISIAINFGLIFYLKHYNQKEKNKNERNNNK